MTVVFSILLYIISITQVTLKAFECLLVLRWFHTRLGWRRTFRCLWYSYLYWFLLINFNFHCKQDMNEDQSPLVLYTILMERKSLRNFIKKIGPVLSLSFSSFTCTATLTVSNLGKCWYWYTSTTSEKACESSWNWLWPFDWGRRPSIRLVRFFLHQGPSSASESFQSHTWRIVSEVSCNLVKKGPRAWCWHLLGLKFLVLERSMTILCRDKTGGTTVGSSTQNLITPSLPKAAFFLSWFCRNRQK